MIHSLFKRHNSKAHKTGIPGVIMYLLFVAIATVLWMFYTFSYERLRVVITLPVSYINIPQEKIIISNPPASISIIVEGKGLDLLRYKLRNTSDTIVIDIQQVYDSLHHRRNKITVSSYDIAASLLLKKKLPFAIATIDPQNITLNFSKVITKKLQVKPMLDISLEQQYVCKGPITISPDSIFVKGPKNIIDTMRAVYTERHSFDQVHDTIRTELNLLPIKAVQYDTTKVSLCICVERYTEASIQVPIHILNKPGSIQLRIFPKHITVKCRVGLNDYDKIMKVQLKASVNFAEHNSNNEYLNVSLDKLPDYAQCVTFSPQRVEYIIEK